LFARWPPGARPSRGAARAGAPPPPPPRAVVDEQAEA
jgi:hypothetical protein